MLSRA
jgi:hypothetical protein